jgi:hypothetical protein
LINNKQEEAGAAYLGNYLVSSLETDASLKYFNFNCFELIFVVKKDYFLAFVITVPLNRTLKSFQT